MFGNKDNDTFKGIDIFVLIWILIIIWEYEHNSKKSNFTPNEILAHNQLFVYEKKTYRRAKNIYNIQQLSYSTFIFYTGKQNCHT